jgi:hypothetical protein
MTQQISKDELAHLQQLARDLVQVDSNNPILESDGYDQTPYIIKKYFKPGKSLSLETN